MNSHQDHIDFMINERIKKTVEREKKEALAKAILEDKGSVRHFGFLEGVRPKDTT